MDPTGCNLPPEIESFDHAYTGTPAWDIGKPQPALLDLFDTGAITGSVLDAGCGTGELALLAASRGLAATGVDSSPRAIAIAGERAAARGLHAVRFEVGDALDLSFLGVRFDVVLDSGLFHVFSDDDRARYVESLHSVLVPGGRCHLLAFSDAQGGQWGPRRIRRDELEGAFATGWDLRNVEASTFELTIGTAKAWRATVRRS